MISIIIPSYNRESLIKETLDSILAQTYKDWECLVVDDGSTDNSAEVVRRYVNTDHRIKLLVRPEERTKGAPTCRNIGFENSKGEYIYFFDSDDLLSPEFFETVLNEMQKYPDAEYVTYQFDYFTDSVDGGRLPSKPFHSSNGPLFEQIITNRIPANTPNFFWKRTLLEKCDMLWREGLPCSQDPDFVWRTICYAKYGQWLQIPALVHVRKHTASIGGNNTKQQTKNIDVRTKVLKYSYDHCVAMGRMSPHLHKIFVKQVFRLQLVMTVLYGKRSISRYYLELLRAIRKKNIGDGFLLVVSNISCFTSPLIYYLAKITLPFGHYKNVRVRAKCTSPHHQPDVHKK